MRWILSMLWMTLTCGAARAEPVEAAPDIVAVLHRSHQARLDAMPQAEADGVAARRIRASFDTLRSRIEAWPAVELRIVRGAVLAETLQGRIVVVDESLADLPESTRLFILAHELGHVALRHWPQVGRLYKSWVPGAVTRQHTDAVAQALGRDASGLSHRHELEADAFAVQALRAVGGSALDAMAAITHQGLHRETATHPSTRRRIAALRELAPEPVPNDSPVASAH
ncbi:M48 family metalloprotease [Ideonella sp. A 288]|uniref:M48 family metalloprotease n=1 Tax=Ideonella sp. A 288 TaxID=1962181 RepID=UPI001303F188|nr:M48 family metalloprotease [Ideonella sp. A 288]